MATGEPIHKLVVHFKRNQYTINNVRSDRYTHMPMLFDVSELAFKDVPSQLDMYITLNLPIPGTCQTLELRTDVDMKRMFQLYQKIENIHVLLKVSQNPPLVAVPPQSEKSVNIQNLEFAEPGRKPNWISLKDIFLTKKGEVSVSEKTLKTDFKRKVEKVQWLFGADLNENTSVEFIDGLLRSASLKHNRDFDLNVKCLPSLLRGQLLPPNVAEAEPLPEVHLQPLEPLQQQEPLQQLEPQPQEVQWLFGADKHIRDFDIRKVEKVQWLFGADKHIRDFDLNVKCLPSLLRGRVLGPNVAEAEPLPEVHLQPLEPLQQLEPQQQEVNSEEDDSASDSEWAAF